MSLAQKNKIYWEPTASLDHLKRRAEILRMIRSFFNEKGLLEVETPLLANATVTDPYVNGIAISNGSFLQTSPEYAMKRLLAAGVGSIFQICKAFRENDIGALHNPEFTLLEWYRVGFNHHDLMNEMDELLSLVLNSLPAQRLSCLDAYEKYVGINPHEATLEELEQKVSMLINYSPVTRLRITYLELLFTHCIQPNLGFDKPCFLYDFPICQAALAKIRFEYPPVASRFEVYVKGVELANGFHELQDAREQRARFEKDLMIRKVNQLEERAIDEYFLAALLSGLPDCSGVALGIDRLVMLALGCSSVSETMSFIT